MSSHKKLQRNGAVAPFLEGLSLFWDENVGISDRVFIDVPETHVEVIGEGRLVMVSVAENPGSS